MGELQNPCRLLNGPGRFSHFLAPLKSGGNDHFVDIQEGGVNQFAIGGRCAGGAAVEAVHAFERRFDDRLLPEELAGLAVEAE